MMYSPVSTVFLGRVLENILESLSQRIHDTASTFERLPISLAHLLASLPSSGTQVWGDSLPCK